MSKEKIGTKIAHLIFGEPRRKKEEPKREEEPKIEAELKREEKRRCKCTYYTTGYGSNAFYDRVCALHAEKGRRVDDHVDLNDKPY